MISKITIRLSFLFMAITIGFLTVDKLNTKPPIDPDLLRYEGCVSIVKSLNSDRKLLGHYYYGDALQWCHDQYLRKDH